MANCLAIGGEQWVAAGYRHNERQPEATGGSDAQQRLQQLPEALDDSELESNRTSLLIALYSSVDERYSLFHASGIALRERVGYVCHGSAAYVGHFLLRHRYEAAESMGALDLTTVSSI